MMPSVSGNTVAGALEWAAQILGRNTEARLEADILLGAATGARRETLYAYPELAVSTASFAQFKAAVRERAEHGCPIAYLTGEREFAGLKLAMRRGVFIPRPETEGLVELVVRWWRSARHLRKGVIVDPCCGSGAIGISLASYLGVTVICIDADPKAVALTSHNADKCGVRLMVKIGNFLDGLQEKVGMISAVAANPPYVARRDLNGLGRDIADYEPRGALDGGQDGLEAIRKVVQGASFRLAEGGLLALEIGDGQEAEVRDILGGPEWRDADVKADLAGRPRYAHALRARPSVRLI